MSGEEQFNPENVEEKSEVAIGFESWDNTPKGSARIPDAEAGILKRSRELSRVDRRFGILRRAVGERLRFNVSR